jgi:hypothetical protein
MSTAKVTAKIAKLGHPEVELVRGHGYHYFVFTGTVDGANEYETVSIMIPFFRDRAFAKWVESGVTFAERVKAGTFDRFSTYDL